MLNEAEQKKFVKIMTNSLLFKGAMVMQVPMAGLSGMKIPILNEEECHVTVPYKHLNKNPFGSTYWAVLGMAAEMACGAILVKLCRGVEPTVSTFVTGTTAKFIKQAKGVTTFICKDGLKIKAAVEEAITSKQSITLTSHVVGYDKDNVVLCEFTFDWGLKQRSK
ncbi:MAG: DUF4442 domain-containing protein [Chitinophagales bacterium]